MKISIMRFGFGALLTGFAVAAGSFISPSSANAQAPSDQGFVSAQAPTSVYITVYGNRYAQIEETRRVHLNAGSNRILLDGIATHYRADSLRVIDAHYVPAAIPGQPSSQLRWHKPFSYLSATYQPANLTPEKLLLASVGKRVAVQNGEQKLEGILLAVNGSTAIVKTDDGKTNVIPASSATVNDLPKGLSNTAALVVEASVAIAGDYDLNFMYETDGITWTAKHSLIFDEAKSVVESWESTVAIENNSGTTFNNACISLLPGKVTGDSGETHLYAARAAAAPSGIGMRDAAVESIGDQSSYTLPEKTTLVDGQSRQVPLFVANNVPVKREYFIPANSPGYYNRGKQEVSIRLEVDNCENNKLGKPIPAGAVKVYQRSSQKGASANSPLQLVGSAQLAAKAVDEVFQMVIGTASDLKWERVLVDHKATAAPTTSQPAYPNQAAEVWETRTYKVKVYNFKRDRDVEVNVEVAFPSDQSIAAPWTAKDDISQAHTKLSVPKSAQKDVEYTVKERVR